MTKWGPWIRHDGVVRPSGLRDDQEIEAVFINKDGELKTDSFSRPVGVHDWEGTVLYRVEQVYTTCVVYGTPNWGWSMERMPYSTHKLTYTVTQDGDVLSCKMEKL